MSLMQWLGKTKTRSHTEEDRVILESTSTTKVTDENGGRDRQQPSHSTEENSNVEKTSNSTNQPKPKPKPKRKQAKSSSTSKKRKKNIIDETNTSTSSCEPPKKKKRFCEQWFQDFFWLKLEGELMFCNALCAPKQQNQIKKVQTNKFVDF